MKKRTAYWLVGGAVVGTAVVAIARHASGRADERVTGLPTVPGLGWIYNARTAYVGGASWFGKPVAQIVAETRAKHNAEPESEKQKAITAILLPISRAVQQRFSDRRRALPRDASRDRADAYSKEEWVVPGWLFTATWDSAGGAIDEFGRLVGGANVVWGHGDTNPFGVLASSVDAILSNPVVQAGLVASGPQGAAVVAGYRMWKQRGELTTPKNAALVAGRVAVESECGAGCGIAFDMGVGVASGKSPQATAKAALVRQLNPQQRAAFEAGARASSGG